MRDRRRAMCCFSGVLSILLLGAGCDRNSNVGNRKDALVDGRPDGATLREASVDTRRPDATGHVGWAVSAGGPGDDRAWLLAIDGSDNIIVAGQMGATAQLGTITVTSAGSTGLFVAKLDRNGKFLWATPLPGTTMSQASQWNGLAVDSSGSIVYAGQFKGTATYGPTTLSSLGDEDGFVVKLDPDGKVLWARAAVAGSGWDSIQTVAVGDSGQLTIGGAFSSTAAFGKETTLTARGKNDLFVARLDGDGKPVWVSQAGSDDTSLGEGVARVRVDAAGTTFAAGSATSNATFGSLGLAGKAGTWSAFVAKLDAAGTFVSVAALPGSWSSGPLQLDASGNIFAAATYTVPWADSAQATISKLSPGGTTLWSAPIPGDGANGVNSLLVSSSGGVIAAGFFSGTVALFGTTVLESKNTNRDYGTGFLARIDPSGAFVHAEQLDGTKGGVSMTGLARDSSGNLYACGMYGGVARFGGTTLTSSAVGLLDAVVWNRGPEPY